MNAKRSYTGEVKKGPLRAMGDRLPPGTALSFFAFITARLLLI
jgi:hypothetical protein